MSKTVSVVTIAYNSEAVIAQTIESVLGQAYRPMEYWIVDGASSDNTVNIAESYQGKMKQQGIDYHVVSEPDAGIYDAMNKGIALATGDIIGILNSGDWYEPDAVRTIAQTFEKEKCDLLFGNIRLHKTDGSCMMKKARLGKFQTSRNWNHPTMFVKAALYKENPFLCKGVHDDYGFYLKMVKKGVKIHIIDETLANFRMGGASNHKSLRAARERVRDRYRWCYRVNGYSRWYLVECVLIEAVKMILG